MLYILAKYMFSPLTYIWKSEGINEAYKFLLIPLAIIYIPIGFVFGILMILIIYPIYIGYFNLRKWFKRKKRRNIYEDM